MQMELRELEELAVAWISERLAATYAEREAFEWVSDQLYVLTYEGDPELLWQLILIIHKLDGSKRIAERLSAGPLEDLLASHGARFIGAVELEASKDPAFAHLLGGVWKNSMTDEVWERVQAAWDRSEWD
jgi:hypothetical protein